MICIRQRDDDMIRQRENKKSGITHIAEQKEEAVRSCRAALVMHRTNGTLSNGTLPPKRDPPVGTKMRPTFRHAQIVSLQNA